MAKSIPISGEITSVGEIEAVVRSVKGTGRVLFRGQNVDKPLLPRIARVAEEKGLNHDEVFEIERRMVARFKRESAPLLGGLRPQSEWDWLSLAQHQGLPTRLLDWTANALAALWFAVASDPPIHENGVLWVLSVDPENEKSPSNNEDPFNLRRTYVFQPFHIDRRITAQSGWFSVHRYSEERGKFIALDRNTKFKGSLSRYSVPTSVFFRLRRELRIVGLTQATMFPDLPGLCADIQAECIGSYRSPENI
jgi:FRG domain